MPIFIKCIFMLWVVTFVGFIFIRIWAADHVLDVVEHKYPIWAVTVGFLAILSILSIIPLVVYLLFFR